MGEFWYRALHPDLMYYQDIRGAASAAHIYGKPVAAAEAYTGGGFNSPYELKIIGDYWFTQGINRFVFHTSAHQPLDTKPGNTMVGAHLNRNITWAEQAEPFMTYLSRNSFMLQQGKFVADIAYLLVEGAPSTMPFWGSGLNPAPPEGYDYDYINTDVLVNRMSVDTDGRLILPDGMSYSVLVLPETKQMTLPVLKKIRELVYAGATVTGPKPDRTPGLSGYPESEQELTEITTGLWGDLDGISRTKRLYGKGKLIWGVPLAAVLEINGIEPDVEYVKPLDSEINWIHRKSVETDIYFIVNSSELPVETYIRFRQKNRLPELWDPATGRIRRVNFEISGNRVIVPFRLNKRESAFVVFTGKTINGPVNLPEIFPVTLTNIPGPWEVNFPEGSGTPEKTEFNILESLTANSNPGIKYFSGTATYTKTIEAPKSWFEKEVNFKIDLGNVRDVAEVMINGTSAGIVWKPPYETDITGLLKKGSNKLEIKVTNQWTNRLAGDQKLSPGEKILNSSLFSFPGRNPDDSGLMGPVRILRY